MTDVHALSGAYAVDALDDLERAHFERHLASCADCRSEVDSLREAGALLAETTTVQPSDSLRERVLAEVATVRPLPPVVASLAERRRRVRPVALVAAAAVVAAGVGLGISQPWAEDLTELSATERVLRADDAVRLEQAVGDATATVVVSESLDQAVIVTEDMESAPPGYYYELWFQYKPNGPLVSAGEMPEAADATVLLDGAASDAVLIGITQERETGGPGPTLPAAVTFDLDA